MRGNKNIETWDSKEFMVSISSNLKDFILSEYTARRVGEELATDEDHFTDPGAVDRIYNQFVDEIIGRCGTAGKNKFNSANTPIVPETTTLARKNQLNYAIMETLGDIHERYQSLLERHPDSKLFDLISDGPSCFNHLPEALKRNNTVTALVKNSFTGAEIFCWLDPELQSDFCITGWTPEHTRLLSEHFSLDLRRRGGLRYDAIPGSYSYKKALRSALTECCDRLYTKHRVALEKFPQKTVREILEEEKQLRTI